jgi:hypothetical protein
MQRFAGRLTFIAVVVGAIAGAFLITTTYLTTNGWMTLVPYAVMLVALLVYFRKTRAFSFRQRFNAAFLSFAIASLIAYAYLTVVVNPEDLHHPLWDNVWPLLVLAAIGAGASGLVAAAAGRQSLATQ